MPVRRRRVTARTVQAERVLPSNGGPIQELEGMETMADLRQQEGPGARGFTDSRARSRKVNLVERALL